MNFPRTRAAWAELQALLRSHRRDRASIRILRGVQAFAANDPSPKQREMLLAITAMMQANLRYEDERL